MTNQAHRQSTALAYCSCRCTVPMATGMVEVIVTVGGEDDKVVLRSVETYDPVLNQWKNLAFLPFAISKHGLVVSGENVRPIHPLAF